MLQTLPCRRHAKPILISGRGRGRGGVDLGQDLVERDVEGEVFAVGVFFVRVGFDQDSDEAVAAEVGQEQVVVAGVVVGGDFDHGAAGWGEADIDEGGAQLAHDDAGLGEAGDFFVEAQFVRGDADEAALFQGGDQGGLFGDVAHGAGALAGDVDAVGSFCRGGGAAGGADVVEHRAEGAGREVVVVGAMG